MHVTISNVLTILLLLSAFFGLVAYRTWQDRREERQQRAAAPAPREELVHKTA